MKRCNWPNLKNNKLYQDYHDFEWGVPSYDDHHLFEMFVLESFHCGLSWLIILKKREAFRKAFDNFDAELIANYSEDKIKKLMNNKEIVRNRRKIMATIQNAKSYIEVKREFGAFSRYIWSFTNNKVICGDGINFQTTTSLSDKVAKDFKKRGFKFMGSVTTLSYLQAVGVCNDHSIGCNLFQRT